MTRIRTATPVRNLPSILRHGLLARKAIGKLKAVWFHKPAFSAWATLHVAARHRVRADSVVILEADVPRSWLCRHGDHWYCRQDVPPERIGRLVSFAEQMRAVS